MSERNANIKQFFRIIKFDGQKVANFVGNMRYLLSKWKVTWALTQTKKIGSTGWARSASATILRLGRWRNSSMRRLRDKGRVHAAVFDGGDRGADLRDGGDAATVESIAMCPTGKICED